MITSFCCLSVCTNPSPRQRLAWRMTCLHDDTIVCVLMLNIQELLAGKALWRSSCYFNDCLGTLCIEQAINSSSGFKCNPFQQKCPFHSANLAQKLPGTRKRRFYIVEISWDSNSVALIRLKCVYISVYIATISLHQLHCFLLTLTLNHLDYPSFSCFCLTSWLDCSLPCLFCQDCHQGL